MAVSIVCRKEIIRMVALGAAVAWLVAKPIYPTANSQTHRLSSPELLSGSVPTAIHAKPFSKKYPLIYHEDGRNYHARELRSPQFGPQVTYDQRQFTSQASAFAYIKWEA